MSTSTTAGRVRGVVKRYGPGDYGFIRCNNGTEIFVGAGALRRSGVSGLRAGEQVEFEIAAGRRGWQAVEIQRLDGGR